MDSIAVAPLTNTIQNSINANSRLQADQNQITNGTTPLDMNNQKITNIATATAGTDALNRDTADNRYY